MEQRKVYVAPSIRDATPAEAARVHAELELELPVERLSFPERVWLDDNDESDAPEPDTWPEAFVCNGCSRALTRAEMAPDSRDETSLGALCKECAGVVR